MVGAGLQNHLQPRFAGWYHFYNGGKLNDELAVDAEEMRGVQQLFQPFKRKSRAVFVAGKSDEVHNFLF